MKILVEVISVIGCDKSVLWGRGVFYYLVFMFFVFIV